MGLGLSSPCQQQRCFLPDAIEDVSSINIFESDFASSFVFSPKRKPRATTKIAVVRHGERLDDTNAALWQGSQPGKKYPYDSPITAEGRRQASSVSQDLASRGFDLVVTSPLTRCVQTAVVICKDLGLPLCIDNELGEVFNPQYFGERWSKRAPELRNSEEVLGMVPPGVRLLGRATTGNCSGHQHSRSQDRLVDVLETELRSHSAFLGAQPVWPETVEDARVRYGRRVKCYASLGRQLGANIVLVTHGFCVQTCATLALASEYGVDCKSIVRRVRYCGYTLLERDSDSWTQHQGSDYVTFENEAWRMDSRGVDFGLGSTSSKHAISCRGMVSAMQQAKMEKGGKTDLINTFVSDSVTPASDIEHSMYYGSDCSTFDSPSFASDHDASVLLEF
eukprot:TRINITY_DN55533_c0_g1_i1.p1 TRINITY_DN55533_c0_g1~~TRINITY_DN55533_c0_g1_i1.p1  ORF type:complete len:393 (-),score=37.37 TRINITY_DN55533_c0_g1_i1:162-1340(-)